MKKIKILSKQIHEELKDARKYAEMALRDKEQDKELAEVYYTLANEEMAHSDKLHAAAVKEIAKYKAAGKEVPEVMQEIWNWQHEEIIEEAAEIKTMIEMYRK